MSLVWILRKIIGFQNKKKLVIEIINSLQVDTHQKELYYETIEILDSTGIDELYKNLLGVMKKIEDQILVDQYSKTFSKQSSSQEDTLKMYETNSAHILIDNI